MTAVRVALYVLSAALMLSAVFFVLPWATMNAVIVAFGGDAYPDIPLVQYTLKSFCILAFWVGVLLAIATRHPLAQQKTLAIFAGLGFTVAAGCLALGFVYDPGGFFYWDALSGLVLGILAWLHRRWALAASGAV